MTPQGCTKKVTVCEFGGRFFSRREYAVSVLANSTPSESPQNFNFTPSWGCLGDQFSRITRK